MRLHASETRTDVQVWISFCDAVPAFRDTLEMVNCYNNHIGLAEAHIITVTFRRPGGAQMANCRYCGLTNAIRYRRCIRCGTPFGAFGPPIPHSWEPPPRSCADVRRRIAALHRKRSELRRERVSIFAIPGHTEENAALVDSTLQPFWSGLLCNRSPQFVPSRTSTCPTTQPQTLTKGC